MLTLTNVFQRFLGTARIKREDAIHIQVKSHAMQEAEDTRNFLLSIAHLPAGERENRIQHREALKQIVARQGIMEAEQQADRYWKQ